jgi:hypothetical protein
MDRYGSGGIIAEVQNFCADLAEFGDWNNVDAKTLASIFNQDSDPVGLFREMDERTGGSGIGYRTRDGSDREWHYILRQMRNDRDCVFLDELGEE